MNVKARMFKNNRQVMLYLDIKGTSDLDCPYIDIDTGWVNRIFKHLPEKAWDNTIINMNICVEYGTGDLWYSRVRTFEGSCCAEYILTSRKPRKNNRRELVNNPEDQLLDFDTVRLDRPCRQRRPFSLGNNRNKYGRNRTTKITG